MAKTKYPIKREFFPFSKFTPSVSRRFVSLAQKSMKTPGFVFRDPEVTARIQRIPAFHGEEIELLILTPGRIQSPAPCLVNIHGGGFVFEAAGSHYRHALTYAKKVCCVVVFVRYRLAPRHPFPYPQEDCYAAFCWTSEHAKELGIDRSRIGIGGGQRRRDPDRHNLYDGTGPGLCRLPAVSAPDLPMAGRSEHKCVLYEVYGYAYVELNSVEKGRPAHKPGSFFNAAGVSVTRGSRQL